jgi:hypothetical protein
VQTRGVQTTSSQFESGVKTLGKMHCVGEKIFVHVPEQGSQQAWAMLVAMALHRVAPTGNGNCTVPPVLTMKADSSFPPPGAGVGGHCTPVVPCSSAWAMM